VPWLIFDDRQKKMPTNSKVVLVTKIVAETFVVTEEEARQHAEGVVALAEGWGDGSPAAGWEVAVQNHLGRRLTWRSREAEERFLRSKRATATAYERYIQDRK
jgi:hypothetical protein